MSELPFTDRTRKVMRLARDEAKRLGHADVNTGHLLLGLFTEGRGVATYVLASLGVSLDDARREVEKRLAATGSTVATLDKLPFAPDAEQGLQYAVEEAAGLNHDYVGTEHVLLGLFHNREGIANQVLHNLGLEITVVRSELLRLLGVKAARSTPMFDAVVSALAAASVIALGVFFPTFRIVGVIAIVGSFVTALIILLMRRQSQSRVNQTRRRA